MFCSFVGLTPSQHKASWGNSMATVAACIHTRKHSDVQEFGHGSSMSLIVLNWLHIPAALPRLHAIAGPALWACKPP